jgi:hypothetical protein
MATVTPNFNWPVPTSTDLVKDGATAIEALGDSIDASLVDLKGGTTGQVLSKTSGTDMDFTWVAQDDSNAIQNTIVDAKGDLIAATAADTPARLAVGTNGHVLTADSTAATGLAWAAASSGSMTLLASGTFSNSALSLTSISGAYKDLVLIFENYAKNATDTNMRLNADSGSNYAWAQYASGLTSFNQTTNSTAIQMNQPNISTGTPNSLYMTIYNYANTNSHKAVTGLFNGSPQGTKNVVWNIASYGSTNAITGISTTDAMTSGSYYLYGVK